MTGADAKCKSLAAAAGLPGTCLAWLSDATGTPSERFTEASVPYTLVDGTVVANDWDDLAKPGGLKHVIDMTESGGGVSDGITIVWSNTGDDGTVVMDGTEMVWNCDNWSADSDEFQAYIGSWPSQYDWTNHAESAACSQFARFYCFQQR